MLEDLRTNDWNLRFYCVVVAYWIAHLRSVWRKRNIINNLRAAPVLVLHRLITERLLGYETQVTTSIGRRFTIHHSYGVVINENVAAEDDFTLRHGVTIGSLGVNDPSCPVIGSSVGLGANTIPLGDVAIRDNVMIGAGSVVVDSIPNNTPIVGEKARAKVIKWRYYSSMCDSQKVIQQAWR